MPYILDAKTIIDQTPRLAWIEATGNQDEVRLTFSNSFEILAKGTGKANELEALLLGGACACTGDLWIERSDEPLRWNVSLLTAPEAGTFSISAFDLTLGLQQVQIEQFAANLATAPISHYHATAPYADRLVSAG